MRSVVKRTLVIFFIAGALAACGFLDCERRSDRNREGRLIASPEGTPLERPEFTPVPEKVPGESR